MTVKVKSAPQKKLEEVIAASIAAGNPVIEEMTKAPEDFSKAQVAAFPPYVSNPSDPDDSVKEAAYNAEQVAKMFPESVE
jgi:hypothetical protein